MAFLIPLKLGAKPMRAGRDSLQLLTLKCWYCYCGNLASIAL